MSRTNRQLLEQVADNLDSYFDDLVRLSYAPAYNTALIEQLEQIRSGFEEAHQELETRRSIEKFLDEMMIYPRKDILHATLVVGHQPYQAFCQPFGRPRNARLVQAGAGERWWPCLCRAALGPILAK